MKNSINFVKSLPLDGISVFLFTPYPNTELGKIAERFGSVSYNWRDYSSHSSQLPYIPEGFSAEEMLQWQRRAYLEFYIRPGYILRNFTRLLDYDFLIDGANLLKNQLLDTLKYNFLKKTE